MTTPVPPHSFQAEVSTLGAMVLDSVCIPDVMNILTTPADFYEQDHALIFSAILHVYDRKNPASMDLVLVQARLKDQGVYERIGGDDKLRSIVEGVPNSGTVQHYAKIVAEKQLFQYDAKTLSETDTRSKSL